MDTPSLKAFVTIAKLGSVSAAAEALYLTQPAISKRLSSLEQRLGVSLFHRVNRQLKLSQAGQALLPRAKQILMDIEDATRTLSCFGHTPAGNLQIGISHHIGLHRLPEVLQTYSTQFPEVKLDLEFVDSEQGFAAVLNGDLELGIVTLPPKSHSHTLTHLRVQEIWADPMAFTLAPAHPLANEASIELVELTSLPAILPNEKTFTRSIVESLFTKRNLNFHVSMSTHYLESIRMLVGIGLGWSLLPKTMLDASIAELNMHHLNLTRSLGYVVHAKRPLSQAAKSMIDLLETITK